MSLDFPIFPTANLKKAFYYFLAFNILVFLASMLLTAVSGNHIPGRAFVLSNTWLIMLALLLLSFAFTAKSKKELGKILATPDYREQFAKYETYYKRKLIWNASSIVISGFFFVMTERNLFFYFLLIQLILSLAFYPRKRIISEELKNPEIVFT